METDYARDELETEAFAASTRPSRLGIAEVKSLALKPIREVELRAIYVKATLLVKDDCEAIDDHRFIVRKQGRIPTKIIGEAGTSTWNDGDSKHRILQVDLVSMRNLFESMRCRWGH